MESFKHKKSLGQNFLKDESVLTKISDSIQTTKEDLLIEIGPGQGALTKYLVKKDSDLICFEIDTRVKEYLSKYESDKCHIVYEDFLKYNLENLDISKYSNIYIIGNLPYYITTPIIEKIVNSNLDIKEMVVMVQKEVALRFAAKPRTKNYGSFTVFLNYYFDVQLLCEVDRTKFDPAPNVDSAVVKFTKKSNQNKANNEELFFKLIYDSFKMKRKNLRNNLKDYNLELIEKILLKEEYSLTNRAEEIPLDVFIKISNEI